MELMLSFTMKHFFSIRWDASAGEMLPKYMQDLYSIIYKTSNEVADHVLKEHGYNMRSLFHKVVEYQLTLILYHSIYYIE